MPYPFPNTEIGNACYAAFSNLGLSFYFLHFFVMRCIEDGGGIGGADGDSTKGIDDFLTVVANEYFQESPQIVLVYDESWDISDMIRKLTITTNKAFVSYFLPLDEVIGRRIVTQPPDHITHKLLPKAYAFMIFVKDEKGFENILRRMGPYPWFTKRARFIVMVKERSLLPTKGILAMFEAEKMYNGVVVTEVAIRNDTQTSRPSAQNNQTETDSTNVTKIALNIGLQVVALDPYPEEGHEKESYVGRWANGELQSLRPIFQEKIDNLRGHTLQVCVFEFPPLVIKRKTLGGRTDYYGMEVYLLVELSRLLNFTYNFFEPPEGERWGTDLGNNTWSGLIGETQRNADFGFASVFLLDNREKAVDVSTPYDQDEGCFAVPRPEALQHWLGLILPFSWQVWVCIISLAFVAGPIFTLITRPLRMDQSMTIGRGIFYALGSLVSAQRAPKAKSHSLRAFIIAWLVFCWLACILYRVALIVSLTVGPSAFKINTIKQLARSGLQWGGYPEVLKTFTNTTDATDEQLFDRFLLVDNVTAALERVAKKGDFALLDSGKMLRYMEKGRYFNGYSSEIHVTKECPTKYNVGFIMPVGSPFLEKVNELIRRLQNAGIIEKWYNDLVHEAAVKNPNRISGGKKKEKGLDIGDLKLCLVLLLGGHFIAFVTCIAEQVHAYYRKRHPIDDVAALIRKVSNISGLTLTKNSRPSIVVTDTEDMIDGSSRNESLYSLPIEMEHDLCLNGTSDTVNASLGDLKAISCPHIKDFVKNEVACAH